MTPLGRYLASLYPTPNYSDPNNLYNYVYSALEPANRAELKLRFDWNISNNTKAYVRDLPRGRDGREAPRRVVGAGRRRRAADSEHRREQGPVVRRQRRLGVEPVDDERGARQLQPPDARQPLQGSERARAGRRRHHLQRDLPGRHRPARTCRPTSSTAGAAAARSGNLWAKANDMYAHNDSLQFSDKLTKLLGSHGLKFGVTVERGQKQQNFQNQEAGQLWFGTDNDTGTGNSGADMLVGRDRPAQPGHRERRATRRPGSRSASSATGTSTPSRRTAGSSARTSRSNTASASASGPTTKS